MPARNPRIALAKRCMNRDPRILGGRWKGRTLRIHTQAQVRPTLTRHRLRLFDWLLPILPQTKILDLFSGSGALGFEALSRGAAYAEFVEKNLHQAELLKKFAQQVQANCEIFSMDVVDYLSRECRHQFNLVFMDPPFDQGLMMGRLLTLLGEKGILETPAWCYCESAQAASLSALPKGWSIFREKIFSNVSMRLYYCKGAVCGGPLVG